ncbi:MAG: hypothetical protein IPJ93_09110 [Bacteroidota bacterium]|nr:MAG: hypothetical protein IPJ93_09110 [Bacteroidota bacterium]
MKNRVILFWLFLNICFLFFSCATPEKKESVQQVDSSTVVQTHFTKIKLEPGKLLSNVNSESNSNVSFSVYAPSEYSDTTLLPIIYFSILMPMEICH